MEPTWRPLEDSDLPGIAALARRVIAVDGGLPLIGEEPFLRRRYLAEGGRGTVAIAPDGTIVAAAAERSHDGRPVVTGLVDPDHRGRGYGARLLDAHLPSAPAPATVETESVTDAAAQLFASRGLGPAFAEDVMRFDLGRALPDVALPDGTSVETWTDETAGRFFAVYDAAFRDRPGFPGWSAEQWVRWTADDDEFRPQWSFLANDDAFLTAAQGWIVQVGVRPDRRGHRLGAALVVMALRTMRDAGLSEVLLDVNVDNPAGALYERLGFERIGRRARFSRG